MGNPGDDYCKTRHNVGFAVIDYLAKKKEVEFVKPFLRPLLQSHFLVDNVLITIVKPLTFMNRSGIVFSYLIRKYSVTTENIIIICDNMDLPPGKIRLKSGGSSAGHNGLKSIIGCIGKKDFKRMYIGIGRPEENKSVTEHVLGQFTKEEEIQFNKAKKLAGDALLSLASKPIDRVMNEINKKNH